MSLALENTSCYLYRIRIKVEFYHSSNNPHPIIPTEKDVDEIAFSKLSAIGFRNEQLGCIKLGIKNTN